jgi:hypothetical protein
VQQQPSAFSAATAQPHTAHPQAASRSTGAMASRTAARRASALTVGL